MEALEKNQTHIALITGYASSGVGVCRIEGRAVFVDFALVGETWEILILKVTASAVYGKGVRLLNASPARREPECAVFGKCGGCSLLHMSYEEELRFKLGRVNDAFARIGGLEFAVPEIIPAESTTGYRNKAVFNIAADRDGHARAGFFRPRSHDLVPITDCLIQSEEASHAANALCTFMNARGIAPYDEKTGKGKVRHLFFRRGMTSGDALAVVVSTGGFGEHTSTLVEALRSAAPSLTGILLCVNKSEGNVILNGAIHTLWGHDYIEDELCGLVFRISAESFFQINPPQAEKLYNRALEYASPDGAGVVLDLFCGAGTITLALAQGAKFVYGAEIVESAVLNARENAARNGITNVEFILGDASDAAAELSQRGIVPDAVVVDPPRKGLSVPLIEAIARMYPSRIVYVSCDPATLARDLKLFSEKGYAVKDAAAVDMFPRTSSIECVVLLTR